jgi:hypothetical protein
MIKKPIYNLMTRLSLLGDERFQVDFRDECPNLGVIAIPRGQDQIAILVNHSWDQIVSSGN